MLHYESFIRDCVIEYYYNALELLDHSSNIIINSYSSYIILITR